MIHVNLIGSIDDPLRNLLDENAHISSSFGHDGCLGYGSRWSSRGLGVELADALRHLSAFGNPIIDALAFEVDAGGVGSRIVSPHNFHGPAIARTRLLDHHHAVIRLFARTHARQSNH